MKNTCQFDEKEKRWEIGLLWKEDNVDMPESNVLAQRRLFSTEKIMDSNPVFAKKYCQQVSDYVAKGYAVKLDKTDAELNKGRIWYLPHFSVQNPNKPDKFRYVYDCAAKSNGVSFNDHLIQGPDLLNSLTSVLLSFREGKVAFTDHRRNVFAD